MKKKVGLLIIFALLLLNANNACFSASQKQPVKKNLVKIDIESELYQKARIELNKSLYQSYRIIERLSRANKLDEYSWRVYVPSGNSKDEINAYAKDGNLIVLFPVLVDILTDDVSSLAFVIAHEMAHNSLNHIAKMRKYIEQTNIKEKESVAPWNMKAEEMTKENILLSQAIGFWSAYFIYSLQYKDLQKNVNEENDQREQDCLAFSRKLEYEADKTALIYMIKAGFNVNRASRFSAFSKRLPGAGQEPTTHPSAENRIWQINSAIKNLDIEKLKTEGALNFKNSKTLTYEKSLDKKSLRINSKYNSSENVNKPFELLFGK
jgi:beta-barrel assembly-enhancing protease